MPVRVIVPPEPIVEPGDISGSHAPTDAAIAALISAAQEDIDGPTGRVGRCFGAQTLQLATGHFCAHQRLPFGPIIDPVSVIYLDREGVEHELDSVLYRLSGSHLIFSGSFPITGCFDDAVRIRYEAGYNGTPVADGGTGDVPERARQAIILSVQHLLSLGAENLFLRSEEVDGVGIRSYTVTDQASNLIHATTDRLLQGLRVYA
jgi:hypothetical protein